ncbi:GtrA family protein [Pedobacter hiemivivus]|uniref:GtrA family protein n=1 Tax=Pedobacter hiemivivus TaxID=2530454 RepID=A0A4U1GQ96_9SPHI|nr:GtrA family protein [Pedobacter hiemivivus]TCC98685.1 GtrA family protein [Pedobacter hiemivivus]TKC65333.1 GtrA family protein [Pedobacter hiemivivus]
MRKFLLKIIDFFYPPFSNWLPLHTFRYLVSGGTTAACGIVSYYIAYNWILHQENIHVDFPFLPKLITAHSAALIISTFISFSIGFTLNKYLVFTKSNLKGRIQMFRYAAVLAINFGLNLAMLKYMVEGLHFYPSVSQAFITLTLSLCSYFLQKHFTFRVKKHP